MLAAAALALLVWLGLVLARGRFWRAAERLPWLGSAPPGWPEVVALIPARDETVGLFGQPAWRALILPAAACLYPR